MIFDLFSGVLDIPWWGYAVAAWVLTHATIVAVTIFLHRHQAHRALELHAAVSHLFRFWLWLTTGLITREWVAVHRRHHARCDTPDDPHSPQILGINRVLWGGVFLYMREACKPEIIERYGRGTPDDWIERKLYSRFNMRGIVLMGALDVVAFGIVPGALIFGIQMIWIPFWAAGVINGLGHFFGYRNWPTPDWSTNLLPFGVVIGGEELHNNHHAHPTSARLSNKWYELDIGWLYIRGLQALGLASVRHVAPTPRLVAARPVADKAVLRAIIDCRYDVLANYAKALARVFEEEVRRLKQTSPEHADSLRVLKPCLNRDESTLHERERACMAVMLPGMPNLYTAYLMRRKLATLWTRSNASGEQLVQQLQDWCRQAEASGIQPLAEFSQRLRSYS